MDRPLSSLANDHEHLAHLDLLAFCHTHTHDRAGAWRGISTTALSVSISTMGWSRRTSSPSLTSQRTISPS